jgi:hypothetical protein
MISLHYVIKNIMIEILWGPVLEDIVMAPFYIVNELRLIIVNWILYILRFLCHH